MYNIEIELKYIWGYEGSCAGYFQLISKWQQSKEAKDTTKKQLLVVSEQYHFSQCKAFFLRPATQAVTVSYVKIFP